MAALLAGLPDRGARRHGQPAVRLRARCRRHGGARDQDRRGRADDRRRRREHDARALRHAQGRDAPSRRDAEIYDTTIGWRFVNPLMKQLLRRRFDAGDRRRTWPPSTGHRARRPGRLRAAQPAARARPRRRAGRFADEIVPVTVPGRARRDGRGRAGRASARRHDAGAARQAEGAVPRRRHGDGRQCLGRQRRRLRADHRLRSGREGARPDAAGARRRRGHGRRAAARHGHRPGPGHAQAAGAAGPRDSARST